MDENRRVLCSENEELAKYMLQKKQELAEKPKGLSENIEQTLAKAYKNVCDEPNPIKTLKDLSHIKYCCIYMKFVYVSCWECVFVFVC